jgi:hypothetical protein
MNVTALAIIDPAVDLTQATGLLSWLLRGVNVLGEQASEFIGGTGTAFVDTAEGGAALNALAQATSRFYIEGRTLALEFANLQQELVRPKALRTDQAAIRSLSSQRDLLQGELQRVQDLISNPQRYTNADISRARQLETYAQQLLQTYDEALRAYGVGSRTDRLPTLDDIRKNPANLIPRP